MRRTPVTIIAAGGLGLAGSPDGANAYVADPGLGMIAEIDTEMLSVLADELLVGSVPVEYFDPSGVPLDATDDVIKCACVDPSDCP